MGARPGQSCQPGCMSPGLGPIQLATGRPRLFINSPGETCPGRAGPCLSRKSECPFPSVHSPLSSFTLMPSPEAMRLFLRNTYRKEVNDRSGIPDQQN